MTGLTRSQWKLLGFIETFVAQHGFSPDFEEMRAHMGLASKSGIHRLLGQLEERGRITRLRHRARSVLAVARSSSVPRETSVAA